MADAIDPRVVEGLHNVFPDREDVRATIREKVLPDFMAAVGAAGPDAVLVHGIGAPRFVKLDLPRIPNAPASGSYLLQSVNGVMSWIEQGEGVCTDE